MPLKIISAFLGRGKGQMPAVIECAKKAGADVLCLQEVLNTELPDLFDAYRFVRFVPMTQLDEGTTMGLATCTNLRVSEVREQYYMGNATDLMRFDESNEVRINETKRRPLLTCDVLHHGETYRVGNTHFLYSKEGAPSNQHYIALDSLIKASYTSDKMALCGAMVIHRGGPLYKKLITNSEWDDWVPSSITCTLDPRLHKLAPRLKSGDIPPVVVDYIFGIGYDRPSEDVCQFFGVCDHTPLLVTL